VSTKNRGRKPKQEGSFTGNEGLKTEYRGGEKYKEGGACRLHEGAGKWTYCHVVEGKKKLLSFGEAEDTEKRIP